MIKLLIDTDENKNKKTIYRKIVFMPTFSVYMDFLAFFVTFLF